VPRTEYSEALDAYVLLQVDPGAHPDVIAAAHRALVKVLHPDRAGGDDRRMAEVNAAFDLLSDPDRRRAYDRERLAYTESRLSVAMESLRRAAPEVRREPPKAEPPPRRPYRGEATMPFGKHKGWAIGDLPDDYLSWLANEADIASVRLRDDIEEEAAGRGLWPR
jgi:curved DNA-binding protein CbpA